MHEDDGAVLRQHDVRPAGQIPGCDAIAEAMRVQVLPHDDFRLGVAPANAGHHPASRGAINDVGHQWLRCKPAACMNTG